MFDIFGKRLLYHSSLAKYCGDFCNSQTFFSRGFSKESIFNVLVYDDVLYSSIKFSIEYFIILYNDCVSETHSIIPNFCVMGTTTKVLSFNFFLVQFESFINISFMTLNTS